MWAGPAMAEGSGTEVELETEPLVSWGELCAKEAMKAEVD